VDYSSFSSERGSKLYAMKVLRVFASEDGLYGNPVGIVIDDKHEIDSEKRQKMASESGFSEVVFINDLVNPNISIFTPKREIPFAGHAVVGASFFLSQELKYPVTELFGIGGKIDTWQKDGLTWVRCDVSILPGWIEYGGKTAYSGLGVDRRS
jgi:hypothetical protein